MKKRILSLLLVGIMTIGQCTTTVMASETPGNEEAGIVNETEVSAPAITSVTEVSRTFLSNGRTQYVYNVTGTDLTEVGVRVQKSMNSKFSTSMYTITREGSGTAQTVTVTFEPWDKLDEIFEEEINGELWFYPTTENMSAWGQSATKYVQLLKTEGEAPEEPEVPGGSDEPAAPAFDNTKMTVKVVDTNGNPVSGLSLYLKSTGYGSYGDNNFSGTTGIDGKIIYTCNDYEYSDDLYLIQLKGTSDYTLETTVEVVFGMDDNWKSYIDTINDAEFKGDEVVLTVKSTKAEEPVVPAFDPTKMTVKVVDTNGTPVSGLNLYLKSNEYGSYGDVNFNAATGADGTAVYTCNNYELDDDVYTIELASGTQYKIETEVEVVFGLDSVWKTFISTINDAEYKGEEVVLTVKDMAAVEPEVPEVKEAKITSVEEISRTFLADGKTEYVYNVTGENLVEVGVRVQKSMNSKFATSMYTITREGEGTSQTVTVTFEAWDKLDEIFEEEINGQLWFYPTTENMSSWGQSATMYVQMLKNETAEVKTEITSVTASSETAAYAYGTVNVTVAGTNLAMDKLELAANSGDVDAAIDSIEVSADGTQVTFKVTFPTNVKINSVEYVISVKAADQDEAQTVSVLVNGVNTITGKEALENPGFILDIRATETVLANGAIPGAKLCPQFPLTDLSLDAAMQEFAAIYKDNNDPIYVLCNAGMLGAQRGTTNLLAAGIAPERIFTILDGAKGEDIKNALVKVDEHWKQDENGWWYENEDGSWPYSTWKLIDDSWYYFNAKGYRVTGWQAIKGVWYFFDEVSGIMAADSWIGDYYVGSTGAMQTGWLQLGDDWYCLGSTGKKVTGWILSKSGWFYLDEVTGIMVTDSWVDGDNYYVDATGVMKTGWLKLDGTWYYLGTNGKKCVDWQKVNGVWYYFEEDGAMLEEGVYDIDGTTYAFNASGAMLTGWQKIDGMWFYFEANGAGKTGWLKSGANWYYIEEGFMFFDGVYYIDAEEKWAEFTKDGVWVQYVTVED